MLVIDYFENFEARTSATSIANCFILQYILTQIGVRICLNFAHRFISLVTLLEYSSITCL